MKKILSVVYVLALVCVQSVQADALLSTTPSKIAKDMGVSAALACAVPLGAFLSVSAIASRELGVPLKEIATPSELKGVCLTLAGVGAVVGLSKAVQSDSQVKTLQQVKEINGSSAQPANSSGSAR